MPIEFRCTKCGKLLRTPDDTGGKQARCPECGTILGIPAGTPPHPPVAATPAAASEPRESLAGYAPLPGSGNPYQSPATTTQAEIGRKPLTFEAAYGHTWSIFKRKFPICFAVVAILTIFNLAFVFVNSYLAVIGTPVVVAAAVVRTLFQWWLAVGMVCFFLKVAQGRPSGIVDLVSGTPWFLRFVGATILFTIAVGIGFVLCFVPGVILGLMFSQYIYLILDRDQGVLESLSKSRELTSGNKLTLLGIFVVSLLPVFLISMPLPLLGASPLEIEILATIGGAIFNPWIYLLSAVCYLLITGQPTADQAQAEPMA